MSESAQQPAGAMLLQRSPWLRPKYLLFAFIGLLYAYVFIHNESFLINPKDPEWQHISPFKWWLLPHGLAAACGLLLGPLQFSDRLRRRFTKLHRVLGRCYVAGALVGAPLGVYIQHFEERMGSSRSFTVAAVFDAILWMLTTGIALAFILNGKVQQHRQWMTRSFAVAPLIFLEARVINGITGWDPATVVWGCLACSILFADFVLQWQELARTRPIPAKAKIATPVLETRFLEALPDHQE
jgi:uncharacterized membrane protein